MDPSLVLPDMIVVCALSLFRYPYNPACKKVSRPHLKNNCADDRHRLQIGQRRNDAQIEPSLYAQPPSSAQIDRFSRVVHEQSLKTSSDSNWVVALRSCLVQLETKSHSQNHDQRRELQSRLGNNLNRPGVSSVELVCTFNEKLLVNSPAMRLASAASCAHLPWFHLDMRNYPCFPVAQTVPILFRAL
jgi:hypothetical protein